MSKEELIAMSNLDFSMSEEEFQNIIKFLDVVHSIDINGLNPFERTWLNLQMEPDTPEDYEPHTFAQNEDGFFECNQ